MYRFISGGLCFIFISLAAGLRIRISKKIQDPEPTYIRHDLDPTPKPGYGFCPTGKPEIRSATLPGVLFLDFITYRPRITSESDQTSQEGNFSLFFFNQDKKSDNNIF